MKYVIGAVVGFALGVMTTATAMPNGWWYGWTVTLNKRVICEDPYIWGGVVREIECERR